MLHTIRTFIESLPPGTFPFIAAAFGLSAFQQKLHKWLRVQSPKVKVVLTLVLSVILVALPVILGVLQANRELIGAYTGEVFTFMTLAYRFVVKEAPSVQADLVPVVPVIAQPTVEPVATPADEQFGDHI